MREPLFDVVLSNEVDDGDGDPEFARGAVGGRATSWPWP